MVSAPHAHGLDRNASQLPPRWSRPNQAAQLTAAGAIIAREPATTPISSANEYNIVGLLAAPRIGKALSKAPSSYTKSEAGVSTTPCGRTARKRLRRA